MTHQNAKTQMSDYFDYTILDTFWHFFSAQWVLSIAQYTE